MINCFSGCSVYEVLQTLGLELKDLYEQPITKNATPKDVAQRRLAIKKAEMTAALSFLPLEIYIVQIAAIQVGKGKPLSEEDHIRLELAGKRITSAMAVLCGR